MALGTIRRMEGFDGAVIARTDTLARVIAALEKVAGGEKLTDEETKVAHEFLYRIGCRADGMVDDGGCF